MIHIADKSNRRLYLEQINSVAGFILQRPEESKSPTIEYPENPNPLDDRFDFAIKLQDDGSVAECLRVCHLKDAADLGLIDPNLLGRPGRGYWVCQPIRPAPSQGLEPIRGSAELWVGLMEHAAHIGERRLMIHTDEWRFATAVKLGLPWRKFVDLGDRFLIAVIDIDKPMVRRLAEQFALAAPCAYRVERADMQAWGSLHRVEHEFLTLRGAFGSRPGSSRALHG